MANWGLGQGRGHEIGSVLGVPATSQEVRKRTRFGFISGDRLLVHNLVVGAGTMSAGILGVAFQSLVSHQLRPTDFGAVFVVVTLVTFVGLPASAFTLLMARETSRGRATGHQASSAALLHGGNRALIAGGAILGLTLALASPVLSNFLATPAELLVAAAVGIPFTVALPLLLGELQGEERFAEYAIVSTGQAGLKLVAAFAFGIFWGPLGTIAGLSLAALAAYLVAVRLVARKLAIRANVEWVRPALRYLGLVLPSTLALAVLLSADVLLVKHYFPSRAAGDYSAVAAMGRAIFWGASGVAIVLFPKITYRGTHGRDGMRLVAGSIVLVAVGGAVGLAILSLAAGPLLRAFAGPSYERGASLLPAYSIGMMFLGAAAVLIAAHQSRGRAGFLAILLPLAVLEPVLIAVFHTSLIQVVQMLDIVMVIVALALGAWFLVVERSERSRIGPIQGIAPNLQISPQLQVVSDSRSS